MPRVQSLVRIGHRTDLDVIDKVRRQKQPRADQGEEHHPPVQPDVATPDLQVTHQQKACADRIEYRIEGWQILYGHPDHLCGDAQRS